MRFAALVVAFGFLGGACGGSPDISCTEDPQCVQGGIDGHCLASPTSSTRWCAFADPGCPGTGQRWGVKSGDGLAAQCVDRSSLPDAGAPTGQPCHVDSDCAGEHPLCVKQADGLSWLDGYCSNTCSAAHTNGSTQLNTDCPGMGYCTAAGECRSYCTARDGAIPCREHYICFTDGCRPTDNYYCDTTSPTCLPGYTCTSGADGMGVDAVGTCTQNCSVFAQDCLPVMGRDQTCYIKQLSDTVFTAACEDSVPTPVGVDQECMFQNMCAPGLGCVRAVSGASTLVCRPYCGGTMAIPCSDGGACQRFNSDDPSGVGFCVAP